MDYYVIFWMLLGAIFTLAMLYLLQFIPWFSANRFVTSQAALKAIAFTKVDGFIVVNHRGKIIQVNNALAEIFGYKKSHLLGQHVKTLLSPEIAERQYDYIEHCKRHGITNFIGIEHKINACTVDGSKLMVSVTVNQLNILGRFYFSAFVKDITEDSKMYVELQYQHNRSEFLFNQCPDGIVYVDENDLITEANEQFLQLLQLPLPHAIGSKITQHYQLESQESLKLKDLWQWQSHSNIGQTQMLARLQPGKPNSSIVLISRQKIIEPSYRTQIYVFRDITEQVDQARKLQQAKLDAETANRAKSEFLSNMSHELRTPLNAVQGFAQLLMRQNEIKHNNKAMNNLSAIRSAGKHLLNLINGILELAKIESGKNPLNIETVNIKDALDEVIPIIAPQLDQQGINQQIQQRSNIPVLYKQQKIPLIETDYTLLKQALLNYLSNAIKYNKPGGAVFVTVDIDTEKQTTKIQVCDNGIGISQENLTALFTPFNRLGLETSNIQGTGIGLAITKKNIELLGGNVGVESKLGAGSTFWLNMPYSQLLDNKAAQSEPMTSAQTTTNNEKLLVLYIENSEISIDLIQGILAEHNELELICSSTLELGLVYAEQCQPNIIFLDLNLPGINPKTVVNQFKVTIKNGQSHIVAITNDLNRDTVEGLLKGGFDCCIDKPISLDNLESIFVKQQALIQARAFDNQQKHPSS